MSVPAVRGAGRKRPVPLWSAAALRRFGGTVRGEAERWAPGRGGGLRGIQKTCPPVRVVSLSAVRGECGGTEGVVKLSVPAVHEGRGRLKCLSPPYSPGAGRKRPVRLWSAAALRRFGGTVRGEAERWAPGRRWGLPAQDPKDLSLSAVRGECGGTEGVVKLSVPAVHQTHHPVAGGDEGPKCLSPPCTRAGAAPSACPRRTVPNSKKTGPSNSAICR
jgi:hypothetical protein